VQTEISLAAMVYNLKRMLRVLGGQLVQQQESDIPVSEHRFLPTSWPAVS